MAKREKQDTALEINATGIDLFLQIILDRYGHDFRYYSPSYVERRIRHRMSLADLNSLAGMTTRIIEDENFFDIFLGDMSVPVTEMFRDPSVYSLIRERVIPHLKTYPFIKVWLAGCATGEEAYSMAILLKEEGLADKAHIYATDYNNVALSTAREGIYPLERIQEHRQNYQQAGGRASLSEYYHAKYGSAKMRDELRKTITFSYHNLVTDRSFGQMHLIFCRNVLIYFDKPLQNRALSLFCESLCHRGFFCLGAQESLQFKPIEEQFEPEDQDAKLYRKCGGSL